jgi:flagellin
VADLEVPEGEMPIPKQPLEITEAGVSVGRVFVAQNSMKFQVGANKGQTVGISVKGTNTENLAKGVANYSGYNNLSDVDVTSFQGAQDALILVDQAINEITSSRGDLGAFQKNTLEANLSNLRIANENLISSESVIRDVDMAKEMAQFTRNQIMTQSATAMLAQANQLPQNVLQLLS